MYTVGNHKEIPKVIDLRINTDQISDDSGNEESKKIHTQFLSRIPGQIAHVNRMQFKEWNVTGGIMDDQKMRKRASRGSGYIVPKKFYDKCPHKIKTKAMLRELAGYDKLIPIWERSEPTFYTDFVNAREKCTKTNKERRLNGTEVLPRTHEAFTVGQSGITVKLLKLPI